MSPSVYLYRVSGECHELYFGEFSTLDGLHFIADDTRLSLVNFGATNNKGNEWLSEKDLPKLSTAGELKVFLNQHSNDLNLIDFEAELIGIGSISSHDDGECHFSFPSKEKCFAVLEKASPQQFYKLLVTALMSNPGSYVTCDTEGNISIYQTFKQYLTARAGTISAA